MSRPPTTPPDPRQYRDTIGMFATGVAVIVAHVGDEALAMTANAVSSVSLDPMLLLFCPGKQTRLGRNIGQIKSFTVNLLRDDQRALSTFFAGGWKAATPPKFHFIPTHAALRLEGSLAALDCETDRVIDGGDHWIVLGRVLELHTGTHPHRPLLFFQGKYRHLNAESEPAPDLANAPDAPFHVPFDGWD
jgi:flavin reductase (DIM6/NTAB) family NADH-FMN oxidoreductase RutF